MAEIKDPFLKRAVGFLVDGVDAAVARDALETEIDTENEENIAARQDLRGGRRLRAHGRHHRRRARSDPRHGEPVGSVEAGRRHRDRVRGDRVRRRGGEPGLPAAGQQDQAQAAPSRSERKTLIAEGVLSIQAGLNPRVLEEKLARLRRPSRAAQERGRQARAAEKSIGQEEKARRAREPRAMAGLVRRLHHAALRVLRRALFDQPRRQQAHGAGGSSRSSSRCTSRARAASTRCRCSRARPSTAASAGKSAGSTSSPRPSSARRPRRRASAWRRSCKTFLQLRPAAAGRADRDRARPHHRAPVGGALLRSVAGGHPARDDPDPRSHRRGAGDDGACRCGSRGTPTRVASGWGASGTTGSCRRRAPRRSPATSSSRTT